MDLSTYRGSEKEQQRSRSLFKLVRRGGDSVLDIGTRDGYFAILLAEQFSSVTALDLVKPDIRHSSIRCVSGNLKCLPFPDDSFDLVFCAEVLEHVPPPLLKQACSEITRVTRRDVIIGVPYKQDIRVGRTTCRTCKRENPPWGHVNVFDENRLCNLFSGLRVEEISRAGSEKARTNFFSTLLMDFAGNPYGTYDQDETCIHCGSRLQAPSERDLFQKAATRLATTLDKFQGCFIGEQANWIHILFTK